MKQVLYRKYRPQNFDSIYGQENIVPILKKQIESGQISHAYLFAGPHGTGKTSTARIFAKELNNGSEIDIIELDAASHNKVEDMREIVDKLSLAPFDGKYKIYILDEAHMITQAAFNAFLKSLEEPPPHVIFILATTEPHKLPQTILSRVQRFDFHKINSEKIVDRLKFILKEENINYKEEALITIAQKSNGALRDAINLLDKVASYGEVNNQNVLNALGSAKNEIYIEFLKSVTDNDTKNTIELLQKTYDDGIDTKVFTSDLLEILKDVILINNKVDLENDTAYEISKFVDDKQSVFIIEELSKSLLNIRNSHNPKIEFMANIIALSNANFANIESYKNIPSSIKNELISQNIQIQALKEKIENFERKVSEMASYPQNPVDKYKNDVDNSENTVKKTINNQNTLSTNEKIDESFVANFSNIKQIEINPEEKERIEKIKSLFPELQQGLKNIQKYNIYALIQMAEIKRVINNNIVFVFEKGNAGMINMVKSFEPSQYVDPILSELLNEKVKTHYLSENELSLSSEDFWSDFIESIKDTFPDANLIIE